MRRKCRDAEACTGCLDDVLHLMSSHACAGEFSMAEDAWTLTWRMSEAPATWWSGRKIARALSRVERTIILAPGGNAHGQRLTECSRLERGDFDREISLRDGHRERAMP